MLLAQSKSASAGASKTGLPAYSPKGSKTAAASACQQANVNVTSPAVAGCADEGAHSTSKDEKRGITRSVPLSRSASLSEAQKSKHAITVESDAEENHKANWPNRKLGEGFGADGVAETDSTEPMDSDATESDGETGEQHRRRKVVLRGNALPSRARRYRPYYFGQ